jgi:hypothetical protein
MAVADALQVIQYDQVSQTPLSVQTVDERQISEELRGTPSGPQNPLDPPLRIASK